MRAVCRSCGAPVRWVETERGKPMPIDVDPVANGNIVVRLSDVRRGEVAVVIGPLEALSLTTEARYVSHFATCPQAETWRRTP